MVKTYLIVGLGNPEGKYFQTWHNMGFLCAEVLAQQVGAEFKKKGNLLITDFKSNTDKCDYNKVFILKPLTYMNNSGQAVVAVARKQNIAPENIIVIYDDLYIDKGNIRISKGGSGGGHNGIKNINQLLGTSQYIQIRIGIKPEKEPHNMADYVLSKIDNRPIIDGAIEKAAAAALALVQGEDFSKLQCAYNITNGTPKQQTVAKGEVGTV